MPLSTFIVSTLKTYFFLSLQLKLSSRHEYTMEESKWYFFINEFRMLVLFWHIPVAGSVKRKIKEVNFFIIGLRLTYEHWRKLGIVALSARLQMLIKDEEFWLNHKASRQHWKRSLKLPAACWSVKPIYWRLVVSWCWDYFRPPSLCSMLLLTAGFLSEIFGSILKMK